MNVLLLPPTEMAGRVAELLERWSAAGMVRPFCCWQAAEIGTVPVVRRIVGGEVEELSLGDALAGAPPQEIEFVGFYPVPAGDVAETGFADLVEGFLDWVRENVLDLDDKQMLACALVVAPGSPEQPVPPDLFRASLVNLLVAPEDRAGPGAVNQLQDPNGDEGRFIRHAAHAAATSAALWAAPSAQRPDLLAQMDERPGPLQVKVRLIRCFSRIVELGHIADHIAAVAFEPRGGWPRPGSDFDRPEDVDRVVRGVANAYLKRNNPTLGRRPFEPVSEEPPAPLGLLAALRLLIAQFLDFVRRRPLELVDDAFAGIHRRAAERIERLDATGKIKVRRWDEDGPAGIKRLCEQLDEEPLIVEDGAVSAAWTELWQTTLGLVDGSDLPDGISAWVQGPGGRFLVVSDPLRIAADPESGEEPSAPPLLQRIREGVESSRKSAQARAAALATVEPEGDEEEPEEEEEGGWWWRWWQRWRRRRRDGFVALLRRVALWSLLALTALVAAAVLLPLLAAAAAVVAILALYVIGVADLARRAFNRDLVRRDEERARELRRLNLALERAQALGDVARLGRRLTELDVWVAVLAELVHRPWVREPFDGMIPKRGTDEKELPTACSVAVARSGQELLERVGARARLSTFHKGWLSGIYRRVESLAMEEYHLDRGGLGAPPDPTEACYDEESPQQALLAAVASGEGRSRGDNPMAEGLLRAIDEADLDDLAPEVVPASPEVHPLGPTATWIQPPPGVAAVAGKRAPGLIGLRGWRGTGIILAPGLVLTAAAALERATVAAVVGVDSEVLEVAETRFLGDTGLALLRLGGGEEGEEGEAEPGAGAEVGTGQLAFGAGVVALEATAAGPKVRWGYVVDEAEPAIVYEGGTPAPGVPVFDLRGDLVAVHADRGTLLEVPEVAELLAMPVTDSPPEPALNGHGFVAQPRKASEFLAGITGKEGAGALLPSYWNTRTGEVNAIEFALPPSISAADVAGPLAQLSDGAAFLRSLRVMVHRVEVTQPVEPRELAACRDVEPVG